MTIVSLISTVFTKRSKKFYNQFLQVKVRIVYELMLLKVYVINIKMLPKIEVQTLNYKYPKIRLKA